MIGIEQIIIALWFLPVVSFIVTLFIACVGILYSIFDVFKPIAGQKNRAV